MANVEQNMSSNCQTVSTTQRQEKLQLARKIQNEERQRKIKELKAHADATQKYREQKEEERRIRVEEMRQRDLEKRQQVEERKRAIMDAEKERREYILKKNMERDSKLELKKRERNSCVFAFGSSVPRLLGPADFGTVSPSTFWRQRRSTSITNVSSLSRRSSERELFDNGSKKRATSASNMNRHDEDNVDGQQAVFRSVARRKTDLMPTILSPRESHYVSRSSQSNTPRTSGRALSMTRLDQLAQPIRRNGEHIFAILERERRKQGGVDSLDHDESFGQHTNYVNRGNRVGNNDRNGTPTITRSMSHLAAGGTVTNDGRSKYSVGGASRSGTVTPGSNISTSTLGSVMSMSMSNSGFPNKRNNLTPRKPRPASIAGPGISLDDLTKFKINQPLVKNNKSTTGTPSKRVPNLMSTSMFTPSSRLSSAEKITTPSKRISPSSAKSISNANSVDDDGKAQDLVTTQTKAIKKDEKTVTAVIKNTVNNSVKSKISKTLSEKNVIKSSTVTETFDNDKKSNNNNNNNNNNTNTNNNNNEVTIAEKKPEATEVSITENGISKSLFVDEKENENEKDKGKEKNAENEIEKEQQKAEAEKETKNEKLQTIENDKEHKNELGQQNNKENVVQQEKIKDKAEIRDNNADNNEESDLMSASMIARNRITTEEEAKAALAERRRLARVEAERQAEAERQRVEAERLLEMERQAKIAEEQRKFEEEALRLAEEQRRNEEQRLRQAIEEAQQREEEERLKRMEEERQRLEREESERKAKEEMEKQRKEVAERLKKEEKEREERRKRVEAIMSRTRKAGNAPANSSDILVSKNKNNASNHGVEEQQTGELIVQNNIDNNTNITTTTTTTNITTNAETKLNLDLHSTNLNSTQSSIVNEPQNTQAMYEQPKSDKDHLVSNFANMVIDDKTTNFDSNDDKLQQYSKNSNNLIENNTAPTTIQNNLTPQTVSNSNGHSRDNINNEN